MGNHRLMKRITFLIGSLGGGGAERVTVALADYFCESGYEVSFIAFSKHWKKRLKKQRLM